jgi:hypothetical protein
VAMVEGQPSDPAAAPARGRMAATASWAETSGHSSLVLRLARSVVARPQAVLAASVVIAVTLNLWETRGQTFHSDEWGRLMFFNSGGLEHLLRGYSGHLVALHALLYKGLLEAFGAGSYLPFRITHALLVGANGLLFYTLARVRAEPWPCVGATLVLLFLGSAFSVLATPYGTVILLPVFFGLAALVCLERFPGQGDIPACLLLIAAVASQSVGLAFVVGATVVLVQQRGRASVARLWVVLAPGALYVAWFAWSRLSGPGVADPVQLHNLTHLPWTVVKVCAAGLAAISGLFGGSGLEGGGQLEQVQLERFDPTAGFLLLGLLVVAAVWRVRSGLALAREVWVPLALALTFWALVGMVVGSRRTPWEARYLYPSAVFLLLILLELARGIRPRPRLIWLGAGALLVSLVPNLVNLNDQARQIRHFASFERSQLGALELLRDEVPAASIPGFRFQGGVLSVDRQGPIAARTYFAAVDRYGSPADSPAEIAAADESRRRVFDEVLLEGNDLALFELPPGRRARGRNCRPAFGPSVGFGRPFGVPPSGLEIRPQKSSSEVTVLARRFATGFRRLSVPPGPGPLLLRPGRSQQVRPWLVLISGATVCTGR